jgi:hypothetical protein
VTIAELSFVCVVELTKLTVRLPSLFPNGPTEQVVEPEAQPTLVHCCGAPLQLAPGIAVNVMVMPFAGEKEQPLPEAVVPFHVQVLESRLFDTMPGLLPLKRSDMLIVEASVKIVCAWKPELPPTAVR